MTFESHIVYRGDENHCYISDFDGMFSLNDFRNVGVLKVFSIWVFNFSDFEQNSLAVT